MEEIEKEGRWEIEIIDLQTINPIDLDTIVESVKKTGRCLVSHEASQFGGIASDIAALVTDKCFLHLEAPVGRTCGLNTHFSIYGEDLFLPNKIKVKDSIKKTMNY